MFSWDYPLPPGTFRYLVEHCDEDRGIKTIGVVEGMPLDR